MQMRTRPSKFALLTATGAEFLFDKRRAVYGTSRVATMTVTDASAVSMMQAPCPVVSKAVVPRGDPTEYMTRRPQHDTTAAIYVGHHCKAATIGLCFICP